jgi:DNA-binding response OmpR family regulator
MRILLVEDEAEMAAALASALKPSCSIANFRTATALP